ncbi:GNAT family N-acetyltransferase, partial [candidate division KSB1 bacterium]|nr:GNAT family N-acetyltransferase [candidate division KSB1 bacterium]
MDEKHFNDSDITFQPLTLEYFQDFEKLFGPKGACAGCWCMWYRQKRSEFEKQKGEENRRAMHAIVRSGKTPGIIAYHNEEPVAWCSITPREEFTLLERSRILKPVDDKPVWSIVCLFVTKQLRRRGFTHILLQGAIEFAKENDAK